MSAINAPTIQPDATAVENGAATFLAALVAVAECADNQTWSSCLQDLFPRDCTLATILTGQFAIFIVCIIIIVGLVLLLVVRCHSVLKFALGFLSPMIAALRPPRVQGEHTD